MSVIELKKERNKVPADVIKSLEDALAAAKDGRMDSVILSFIAEKEDDDEEIEGATYFWNNTGNAVEILGYAELLKSAIIDQVYEHMLDVNDPHGGH
jgi:hypothetical protein